MDNSPGSSHSNKSTPTRNRYGVKPSFRLEGATSSQITNNAVSARGNRAGAILGVLKRGRSSSKAAPTTRMRIAEGEPGSSNSPVAILVPDSAPQTPKRAKVNPVASTPSPLTPSHPTIQAPIANLTPQPMEEGSPPSPPRALYNKIKAAGRAMVSWLPKEKAAASYEEVAAESHEEEHIVEESPDDVVERVLKALPCQPKDPVHREDLPWKDAEFERMIEGREDVHRILERFAATIEANRLVRLKISTEEQKRVTLRSRQLQKMYVGTVRQIEGHHPDDAKSRLPSVGEFLRLPETLQAIQEPNEDQWRCFKGGLADFVLGQFRNEVIRMWSARARAAEMEDAGQDFPIDLSTLPPTGFESHKTTTLLATLRKAACVFYCHQCDTVHWVDTVVRHIVLIHNGSTAPLRMVSPGLVNRLLLDMGHMKGVVTVAEEYNMPILICTRCDSGVARYKTFEEMVLHLHQEHDWWRAASNEACNDPSRTAYSGRPFDVFPEIRDPHGRNEKNGGSMGSLVAVEDSAKRRAVHEVERQAYVAKLEDEVQDHICRLCPQGYGPPPLGSTAFKRHVATRHGLADSQVQYRWNWDKVISQQVRYPPLP